MNEIVPTDHQENNFFKTGGTMAADAPSYVERSADKELYECLNKGEYAYILTPRQMGKSSLMTRTAARLRANGVHVAVLDLTRIGGDLASTSADKWYRGLANEMLRRLELTYDLNAWWKERAMLPPLNRLMNFFEDVLLKLLNGNIVVSIDEIDTTIKLPFSDDFFAAIRACFNARANQADFDRICFVLIGVASPPDLIRDATRTPFNIGRRIDLTDFDFSEARHFIRGLQCDKADAERLLKRVLYWTNGHPYLTQKLCVQVQKSLAGNESPEACVDKVVKTEFLGVGQRAKEDNLRFVDDRIAKAPDCSELLKVYAKVRKGKCVQDQPQSPLHSALKLSGLVKTDVQGTLVVRNEIYKRVFDAQWINRLSPSRWKQRAAIGSALLLVVLGTTFGWWIGTQQLTMQSGKAIILAALHIAYPEPEMVKIPAGSFTMGSPETEKERGTDEKQHKVEITQAFELGKTEVTFDEYDVFAFLVKYDGGCKDGHEVKRPSDSGWGRGKMPVINVSWEDATCYAEWLSRKTKKNYSLPTEAQWEYAARAGTQTPFYTGECINTTQANYNGTVDYNNCGAKTGVYKAQTVAVGSYPLNPGGLSDMAGNVWEWTCSEYDSEYSGKEQQCTSNNDANVQRVLRGGGWNSYPRNLRAAGRGGSDSSARSIFIGFRLSRM